MRRDIGNLQKIRADKLLENAAVIMPGEGAGIPEVKKLQSYLAYKYKICFYRYGSKGRDIMLEGAYSGCTSNLLYHKDHFNVIWSLILTFCFDYYCEAYHITYTGKHKHRYLELVSPASRRRPVLRTNKLNILTAGDMLLVVLVSIITKTKFSRKRHCLYKNYLLR